MTIVLGGLSHRSWREPALIRTAAALAGGVAAIALAAPMLPLSGVAPAIAAIVVFAAAVGAIGGVNRADIGFARQVLGRSRPAPSRTLSPEAS